MELVKKKWRAIKLKISRTVKETKAEKKSRIKARKKRLEKISRAAMKPKVPEVAEVENAIQRYGKLAIVKGGKKRFWRSDVKFD